MENKVADVPYIYYESSTARLVAQHDKERKGLEKIIFRQWITILILALALIGMFIYEAQFEEVVITAEQSADGNSSNYAIGGDYFVGEAESDNQDSHTQSQRNN
jgi:hypothetical protein